MSDIDKLLAGLLIAWAFYMPLLVDTLDDWHKRREG
jgi:hypothetical protein